MDVLREKVRDFCEVRPGVYRFFSGEETIYIGRSKRLRQRLLSYFRAPRGSKAQRIVNASSRLEWEYTPSDFACHLKELHLIKKEKPCFNRALKGEKDFVFIHVGEGPAPKLGVSYELGEYGPFRSFHRTKDAVRRISDLFQLRTSSDHTPLYELPSKSSTKKPPVFKDLPKNMPHKPRCIRGQIGFCLAPCAGKVPFQAYQKNLKKALSFLRGGEQNTLEKIRIKMKQSAEKFEFEKAAVYRDRLFELEVLQNTLLSLKESLDNFNFVYTVAGRDQEEFIYFIHGGRVIGMFLRSEQKFFSKHAKQLAKKMLSCAPRPKSANEMDEVRVISYWFRAHPEERNHIVSPQKFLQKQHPWFSSTHI